MITRVTTNETYDVTTPASKPKTHKARDGLVTAASFFAISCIPTSLLYPLLSRLRSPFLLSSIYVYHIRTLVSLVFALPVLLINYI